MVKTSNSGRAIIEDGVIVIRLDVDALPFVVDGGWDSGAYDTRYKVTDSLAFANCLVDELNSEGEDGNTRVHKMFDAAILEAVDQGALGIDEHEDQER